MRHRALFACRSPPQCQPVPVSAARRHRDRAAPAQPGEGRLRAQAVPVVSGSYQQLPGGLDPTPGRASSSGATAVTRGVSWVSRSSISACSACQRRASARKAVLTAEAGVGTLSQDAGQRRARIRCLEVSLRSEARTDSGAVRIRASSWAPAWMRGLHRTAPGNPQHPDHLHLRVA